MECSRERGYTSGTMEGAFNLTQEGSQRGLPRGAVALGVSPKIGRGYSDQKKTSLEERKAFKKCTTPKQNIKKGTRNWGFPQQQVGMGTGQCSW